MRTDERVNYNSVSYKGWWIFKKKIEEKISIPKTKESILLKLPEGWDMGEMEKYYKKWKLGTWILKEEFTDSNLYNPFKFLSISCKYIYDLNISKL